jgi:hypothetical protein
MHRSPLSGEDLDALTHPDNLTARLNRALDDPESLLDHRDYTSFRNALTQHT